MDPMLKYSGGKRKELNEIKKFLPEYEGKYIEPFFGGGALFFDLEPERAIINDLNRPLMEFYQGVKYEYDKKYAVNIRNRFKSSSTHVIITNY